LIHNFVNKFAAISGKRFQHHLNCISTLPCEIWMLIAHVLPSSC